MWVCVLEAKLWSHLEIVGTGNIFGDLFGDHFWRALGSWLLLIGSSWLLLVPLGSSWLPLAPPSPPWFLLAPTGSYVLAPIGSSRLLLVPPVSSM